MRTQKILRKSMYWSRHGAHAKIDPRLTTHERRRLPTLTRWYGSMKDLMRR